MYKTKLKKKKEDEASLEGSANVTIGTDDDKWGDDVDYSGLMFTQSSTTVKDENDEAVDYDHILEQSKGAVDKLWVLLDNQSTVNIFFNGRLLRNIRTVKRKLTIYSTGGKSMTRQVGDLPGFGEVWYHPEGIANILSLALVKKLFRITYDSHSDNTFHVHLGNSKIRSFHESKQGLYYSDMRTRSGVFENVLVNTVRENKSKFAIKDYSRAVTARRLQNILGVSEKHLKKVLNGHELKNSPVFSTDVETANHIFGPSTKMLQGKTPAKKGMHVIGFNTRVPLLIAQKYRNVVLTGDIMKINKINFLIIRSRHLKFTTSAFIINQKQETMMKVISQVHELYRGRGFQVRDLLMDGQFQCLEGQLSALDINLNICSNAEHVGEIERSIRTVKDRVRCIYVGLPF